MSRQSGATFVELLVVLAILGIGLGMASIFLQSTDNALQTSSVLLEASFREARLMAIAETAAYRVVPQGSAVVRMEHAATCADTTWASADSPPVELPEGVAIQEEGWAVCFNSRGISSDNVVVTLAHASYGTRQVEVLLGGTTRVLD